MGNKNPEAKTSRIPKNGNQDSQNLGTNYTNNNYTENNYTQSVSQSENLSCVEKETGQDVTDRTYAYIELVKSNIAYDSYMSDPTFWHKDLYEELFMTICDVVCVPRDTMRIGGRLYPYSIVQSQFLKLTNEHLEYVLGKMEQNTSEIKNINAYLVTALYNASISMNYSVAQAVRHDMTQWSEEQKI